MRRQYLPLSMVDSGSFLYDEFQYPAGETQVRLTKEGARLAAVATDISISVRGFRSPDLLRLSLLKNALIGVNHGLADYTLILPYLPYAREDRRFVPGDCLGIAAFGQMIDALGFSTVATLDVHSSVSEKSIRNLRNISPENLILKSIYRFVNLHRQSKITILYPDEGAAKRYQIASCVGNNHHLIETTVVHCHKQRDATSGVLSGFSVPEINTATAIVIDDICDGGGTFLGIAETIKKQQPGKILGLYVTHGIFSKGIETLRREFANIYCTDSFRADITAGDAVVFCAENEIHRSLSSETQEVAG
jgi:ribose-phosphate pyrophosphokinase